MGRGAECSCVNAPSTSALHQRGLLLQLFTLPRPYVGRDIYQEEQQYYELTAAHLERSWCADTSATHTAKTAPQHAMQFMNILIHTQPS